MLGTKHSSMPFSSTMNRLFVFAWVLWCHLKHSFENLRCFVKSDHVEGNDFLKKTFNSCCLLYIILACKTGIIFWFQMISFSKNILKTALLCIFSKAFKLQQVFWHLATDLSTSQYENVFAWLNCDSFLRTSLLQSCQKTCCNLSVKSCYQQACCLLQQVVTSVKLATFIKSGAFQVKHETSTPCQ